MRQPAGLSAKPARATLAGVASELPAHFQEAVRELSRRRRYLVAVSGGADSVALLRLLHQSGFEKLIVGHLDHGLRGGDSRGDAAFVRRLAARLKLPCKVATEDVAGRAAAGKLSLETAGREARHEFFARLARAHRCDSVFLGHHADDQAETILFNLLRGTGLAGLAGMRPRSELCLGPTRLRLLRPLLGFSRRELEEYLAAHRWKFRTDLSNTDVKHQRNNLRHRLLPELGRLFGRDVRSSLLRLGRLAAAENDLLEELTPAPGPDLSVNELRRLPLALQRRLVARWLRGRRIPDSGFEVVERVRSLLETAKGARVNLPGGSCARRRAGVIFVDGSGLSSGGSRSRKGAR